MEIEQTRFDSRMISVPNITIYFQLLTTGRIYCLRAHPNGSDCYLPFSFGIGIKIYEGAGFIVRLIDHLPRAGTQHQLTYQTKGNMIIIITPNNHRLTSFSLDCIVLFPVIALQLLALLVSHDQLSQIFKSLNVILFDDLLMLSRRLGWFPYCIIDLFFLAEQVNLFHKFSSSSDLYMKTNLIITSLSLARNTGRMQLTT